MRAERYLIDGPWPGRLFIAPRPRGGDWLDDEVQSWRRSEIDAVLSLLTTEENHELNLSDESRHCRARGIEFLSLPIPDRGIPESLAEFSEVIAGLLDRLAKGESVAVHCRQGIGRAGLVAIATASAAGVEPDDAIARVALARGCPVPETAEQRRWVMEFAKSQLVQLRT